MDLVHPTLFRRRQERLNQPVGDLPGMGVGRSVGEALPFGGDIPTPEAVKRDRLPASEERISKTAALLGFSASVVSG
jgi:hypothetical protein